MAVYHHIIWHDLASSAFTLPLSGSQGYSGWTHLPQIAAPCSYPYVGSPEPTGHFPSPPSSLESTSDDLMIPRGPPARPKSSDYAVWVGNLPEHCQIEGLRDYFAQDLSDSIISIRLISKTKCAFVNYKTQTACLTAIARFHGVPYKGNRLACKLRQYTGQFAPIAGIQKDLGTNTAAEAHLFANQSLAEPRSSHQQPGNVRFFVMKSLTVADLQNSIVSGLWSTQPHVEAILDAAYSESEAVYLMFSVNKSGEFFGYAQMRSSIGEIDLPVSPSVEKSHNRNIKDQYRTATAATETAPAGHVTDDREREIHFWEVDTAASANASKRSNSPESNVPCVVSSDLTKCKDRLEKEQSHSGAYFRVQWISLRRLPFWGLNGVRNSFNHNRPIQVARNGTEIDMAAAKTLITFFHTWQET